MSENKGLGRKILNIFFEEAPEAAKGTPVAPATPSQPVPAPIPKSVTPSGTTDAKFIDHFASVLEKNNLPGPDYFEFRATLKNLTNLGLSEEQQFQAAWASFKALSGGTDPSGLVTTANQYLSVLQKDREAFLKSVDLAVTEKVGGLQNEQKTLEQQNEALAKQILDIQNQINANKERLTRISGEVDEQSGKLTQNRANYEATFQQFTEQIKNDTLKIGQYLKS
ncbi:hypothetical protein [Siphonobacter sp.]|uniref:hypothetical protein n=1 Tax=Siphonobacter sp. TaxID=1869184 RepID=UPI003B3B9CC1